MAELTKWRVGDYFGDSPEQIFLLMPEEYDDFISISPTGSLIVWTQDGEVYHNIAMSPDEAITALEEAIAWIKEQTNNYE